MRGDIRILVARRKSILGLLVKASSHELTINGKLILISYRFSREATYYHFVSIYM